MLDHPNVVRFEDCFEDAENVYMVLELCEHGVSQVKQHTSTLLMSTCSPSWTFCDGDVDTLNQKLGISWFSSLERASTCTKPTSFIEI